MLESIEQLLQQINSFKAENLAQVEEFRVAMLGKKGAVTALFDQFRALAPQEKKALGSAVNSLKTAAMDRVNAMKEELESQSDEGQGAADFDPTRPASGMKIGTRHPISLVRNQIVNIFHKIGYVTADGPEIEDDWHVFGALNFPPEHPARDMQDTFFVDKNGENDILLRTHTSSIQVRAMQHQKPPIRVICPGRVFRNEAISYRAHCIFHQIEGLYIDEGVSFADLKQTIEYFAKECFGEKSKIRLRPSYFPFTEPSAEVDVSCNLCGGKGCNVCKYTGWLEIMGAGMVDPNVLEACGIDSKKYSGFAFGMGVERITMLRYGVKDLRLYFENDVRFLEQFRPIF
ncbi:MAG: phenylalanine--tRNA ligase subunit alpha [Rikenellaceae bacterium]